MSFNKRGFTIVELMIATAVFGLTALLVTSGVIYLATKYQQARAQTEIENISRQVLKDIQQSIKLGTESTSNASGIAVAGYQKICFANGEGYIYAVPNSNPSSFASIQPGLYKINQSCSDKNDRIGLQDLLPNGSKVTELSYQNNVIKINIIKASGGDDLATYDSGQWKCISTKGREWCAQSYLEGYFAPRT